MESFLGILVVVALFLLVIFKGKFAHRSNDKYDYSNQDNDTNVVDINSDDD